MPYYAMAAVLVVDAPTPTEAFEQRLTAQQVDELRRVGVNVEFLTGPHAITPEQATAADWDVHLLYAGRSVEPIWDY